MEFRRNASERRRRVLIEENLQETAAPANTARTRSQQTPLQNYAEGAQRAHQPHLTDLLPKRRWTLAVLSLIGPIVISGLIALYGAFYVLPLPIPLPVAEAFDVDRADSVAGWFMAACLAAASHISWIVFLLRRHRVDDYRGRYRMWVWFSALLLLASVESLAGTRYLVSQLLHDLGNPGARFSAEVWNVLLVGSIAAVALLRVGIEMRRSWGACALLLIAMICYSLVAAQSSLHFLPPGPFCSMAICTALLLGHYVLLGSIAIYARYVYLDAHGCLSERKAKAAPRAKRSASKTASKKKESKAAEARRRTDLEQQEEPAKAAEKKPAEVQPAEKKVGATITAAGGRTLRVDAAHSSTTDSTSDDKKLSKAERKKLRGQTQS